MRRNFSPPELLSSRDRHPYMASSELLKLLLQEVPRSAARQPSPPLPEGQGVTGNSEAERMG